MIDFLVSCGDGKKTVITATHDLDLLEDIADYCHVFQGGQIVAAGTPDEILRNHELLKNESCPRSPSPSCLRRNARPPSSPRT